MAREYGKIKVSIWSDPDFTSLSIDAQHAFFMLVSQAKVNYVGVIDYLPDRLATLCVDHNGASLDATIKALEATRYVVVDRNTSELLIRSFIRHDGLLKVPNITKAVLKDYATVLSPVLREAIEAEMVRCYQEDKKLAGWKVVRDLAPTLYEKVTAKGSAKGSGNPFVKGSANLEGKAS